MLHFFKLTSSETNNSSQESGGVTVRMYRDGMTRAPVVQFANVARTL